MTPTQARAIAADLIAAAEAAEASGSADVSLLGRLQAADNAARAELAAAIADAESNAEQTED